MAPGSPLPYLALAVGALASTAHKSHRGHESDVGLTWSSVTVAIDSALSHGDGMTAAKELREKYKEANRYANFGPVIRRIRIEGFRGITGLELMPSYPVLALSGLNGSGKSTVGQLMACAYRAPTTAINYKRYYVKEFFPSSVLDPSPFATNAKVS